MAVLPCLLEDIITKISCLDHITRADLIESTTQFYVAQVLGPNWASNPLHRTVLAANSEDDATALQLLQTLYRLAKAKSCWNQGQGGREKVALLL